ncbi:MAG: 2,3-diphosphoglycerate-dependent phosphoglycerate mutase [Lactobacillus sp.]|nr:2,3-diphosphoglycerate-dependent phosphoglycerate mutase [Lactobacillus sp.]
MVKLVLVRHGQSLANQENVYTGWSDSPLTEKGIAEAKLAGRKLSGTDISFAHVHTSVLKRAIKTADLIISELDQAYLPLTKTWRLNERHYGALRGLNKDVTRKLYGEKQVALWRRSYDAVPPLLKERQKERRYQRYPASIVPKAESLKMASKRIIPYWVDHIAPELLRGKNQLVVAHGSTLRALIKYLEAISDEGIDGVEVANAAPIVYELDEKLQIISKTIL